MSVEPNLRNTVIVGTWLDWSDSERGHCASGNYTSGTLQGGERLDQLGGQLSASEGESQSITLWAAGIYVK